MAKLMIIVNRLNSRAVLYFSLKAPRLAQTLKVVYLTLCSLPMVVPRDQPSGGEGEHRGRRLAEKRLRRHTM